jgi:hypothetical protein
LTRRRKMAGKAYLCIAWLLTHDEMDVVES